MLDSDNRHLSEIQPPALPKQAPKKCQGSGAFKFWQNPGGYRQQRPYSQGRTQYIQHRTGSATVASTVKDRRQHSLARYHNKHLCAYHYFMRCFHRFILLRWLHEASNKGLGTAKTGKRTSEL